MECYCAKIASGMVTQVIVCSNPDWAAQHLGGKWICTEGQLVGIGWTYGDDEGCRPPPPYASWEWDGSQWKAPVAQPAEGNWWWDEPNLQWQPMPDLPPPPIGE